MILLAACTQSCISRDKVGSGAADVLLTMLHTLFAASGAWCFLTADVYVAARVIHYITYNIYAPSAG